MEINRLYQTLQGLSIAELDKVMAEILFLRKQKLTTVLSQNETDLLQKINAGLPVNIQKRYDFLAKRRRQETLLPTEYEELLALTAYTENHQTQRLKYLIELADLRNKTLDELMQDLQIQPTLYVS